ncbi:hypothetical protein EJ06DRAFT_53473 [Trichodelitschia bisporula]|uniref:Uncharacterized protein n=1 Tax=Trichodelitschia bisporula TaxID=703511 RepID=A0A6G1HTY2_9PEZI|nr:hypothetical protein EJ06DRAFT_53473 [Trichodelitschia bisporula]
MATTTSDTKLPRVAITYCTKCGFMLRAAYFAQELLTTFSTVVGEVALIPGTGGIFTINLAYVPEQKDAADAQIETQHVSIWDQKVERRFPDTKVLKQRIRDHLQPDRHLGHTDSHPKKEVKAEPETEKAKAENVACEDCATA